MQIKHFRIEMKNKEKKKFLNSPGKVAAKEDKLV